MAVEPNWGILLPASELSVACLMATVAELRQRNRLAALSFAGAALIFLTITVIAGSGGSSFGFPKLGVPPILPFFLIAGLIAAILASFGEYRKDSLLKTAMKSVGLQLRDFEVECRSRLNLASRTTTEQLATERYLQRKELHQKFDATINDIGRRANLLPEMPNDLGALLLGSYAQNAETETIAKAGAAFLSKVSDRLPQPRRWLNRRSFKSSAGLYLSIAATIWLLVWYQGPRPEQPSPSPQPTVLTPSINGSGGVSGSWTIIKPGQFPVGDPRNVPSAVFVTLGDPNRYVTTSFKPNKLRFVQPTQMTISASDLPATIKWAGGSITVKKFTDKGFVVDENGLRGVNVEAEIYP